jgi:hypothetical protein
MPKPWISKTIKGLLHASWILLVSLVAVELILNILDPLGLVVYSDAADYFNSRIINTDYGYYINRPGDRYDMRQGVVSISINNEGLRGDDFDVEKPDGTIRTLVLGDSMVFGWGAPQDSLFPVALEKMAKEEGFPCEVIAAGAGSWDTRAEFDFLRHKGKSYNPDILLLLIVNNDLVTAKSRSPRRAKFLKNVLLSRTGVRHSYLVRTYLHFENQFLAGPEYVERYERDPTVFDKNVLALGEMMTLCRTLNIRPIVFLGVTEDGSSAFDKVYLGLYTDVLKQHGVTAQTCEVFFKDRSLKVSPADRHPSALGPQRIAQIMYPSLRSILVELTGAGDYASETRLSTSMKSP